MGEGVSLNVGRGLSGETWHALGLLSGIAEMGCMEQKLDAGEEKRWLR